MTGQMLLRVNLHLKKSSTSFYILCLENTGTKSQDSLRLIQSEK